MLNRQRCRKKMFNTGTRFYRMFMTGGINPADPYNPEDNKDHVGMAFIR
jgi:hypothetical protein